jgi:hypothetical protein
MENCTCANSSQNLGSPNCVEVMKYANRFFLIPLTDNAGVANKIASGTTVDNAFIIARLNDTDSSQRWFLISNVKNAIIAERGDDVNQDFEDGSSTFIEEGVATTSFIVASSSPTMVGKLKSHRCSTMGFMYVDKDGRIWGLTDGTGDLYPIAIEPETLSVKAAYPTPTATYTIPVTFKWRKDMYDEDLGYWDNSVTWSNPTIASLLDVNVAVSNITTTGYKLTLTYDYGAVNSALPVKGLVVADFVSSVGGATSKVRRTNNTPADVSITSVTESPDGVYTFVIPTATSADTLQPAASKQGFDFSRLLDETILIP